MVTDFLPTSLISNEHSTLRSVCISRQIISLSKLALMMGSGGGWWWWGVVSVQQRGGFLLPNHSPVAHTGRKDCSLSLLTKALGGRVDTHSRWSCQMFYVEEN